MTISEQKTIPLIQEFEKTRNTTLELVKTLKRDDFVVQTEFELNHLKPLLDRSLWGWLGVAAILTILGL